MDLDGLYYDIVCIKSKFSITTSCRIFEHFATNPDPVTEFTKLGFALSSKAPLWHQNSDPLSL